MTPEQLANVIEATWPAATKTRLGAWTIREGAGGGQRVSAATLDGDFSNADLAQAEAAMEGRGPIFRVVGAQDDLDAALEAKGYRVSDPTVAYAISVAQLTQDPLPPVSAFALWPPLAIQNDLWTQCGTGPERLAIMERCDANKAAILGRNKDQPAGVGFVGCLGETAMIHAIEVVPDHRRQGVATNILRCAAFWAQSLGASHLALLVTRANAPANALYTSLGFEIVGHYHYRVK